MRVWLGCFVIGAFLGAVGDSQQLLFGLFGALGLSTFQRDKRVILGSLALFWGAFHNPNTNPPKKSLLKIEEHDFSFQRDASIVRSGMQRYLVFGRAKDGSEGTVRCFNQEKLFFQTCLFVEKRSQKFLSARSHPFTSVESSISNTLGERLDGFGRFWRGWFEAVVLGKKDLLDRGLVQLFRDVGLIHLLVISGFHVSLVAGTAQFFIRLPFQLVYVAGFFGPESWRRLHIPLLILSSLFAILFSSYVGFSGACQRALLFFLLRRWWPVFLGGESPLSEKVLWTATFQSLLFPTGFLSTGNLLSWGAFLLVLPLGALAQKGIKERLLILFKTEIQLTFLTLALLGKVTALSVWANLLLAPLFSVVFFPALFWLAVPNAESFESITKIIFWMQETYVDLVDIFSRQGSTIFSRMHAWEASPLWRWMIILLLAPAYGAAWKVLKGRKQLYGREVSCYPKRNAKENLWNVPGKANRS